jgi:hypothetical protein
MRFLAPGITRHVPTARHLLFARNGTLLAQPFDAGRAQPGGQPVTIATSVGAWSAVPGMGWFKASREGHPGLLLRAGRGPGAARLGRPESRAGRGEDDAQSIWALSLEDGGVGPVFDARFRVDEPQLSPDERWLAWVSLESGRDEVYVEPYRRDGDRVRVSLDGGGQPKWRGDGKELFFTTPENLLMAVAVRASSERLEVGLPAKLFEIHGLQGTGYDDYAPSANGQRFLVKLPVEQGRRVQLHVVTNGTSLIE